MVELNDVKIALPRYGDQWLMRLLIRLGYTSQELERLNRVRISFQVLFLSDILGASGHLLDEKYLRRREVGNKWPTYNFPKEKPPNKDINLWQTALRRLVPVEGRNEALGQVTGEGHKSGHGGQTLPRIGYCTSSHLV